MSLPKMDCPSENELLARVSGALPSDRAEIIDAHIDDCADCRVLLAEATLWQEEPRGRAGAAATFAVGEIIADRYAVTRWLATGGMGEVYEVHDRSLDEQIALKTVVATIADDELALARLKAEVRLARRVTHENVCRVYDLGFHQRGDEQIAFLTMELLRGITLRSRLREVGRLDVEAALPLIAQMVAALGHAHAARIVHRDFKSDNVMLVPARNGMPERLVVMDFGLARQSLVGGAQPLTPHSRAVFGTLDYMSPEQVMGKPASPASDIYSLGVVIYEILAGRLPFEGDSPLARAVLRITQKAPALIDLLPGVDPAVNACIARCLETRGERRFATVDEVLRALQGDPRVMRSAPFESRRAFVAVALSFVLGIGVSMLLRPDRTEQVALPRSAVVKSRPHISPVPIETAENPVARPANPAPVSSNVAPDAVARAPSATAAVASTGLAPRYRAATKRAAHGVDGAQPPRMAKTDAAASGDNASPLGRTAAPVPSGDALMNPFLAPTRAKRTLP